MSWELTAAEWAMASFGVQAATSVANFFGQQDNSAAQQKAAWDNYYAQQAQMQEQAKQIQQTSNNDLSERAIQAEIEKGKLRAVAGEAGIAGNTVEKWFADSDMQEARDAQSIETNKSNKLKQNMLEQQGQYARAKGAANVAESKEPSLLGTGLQIAGAYANYEYKTKLPSGKT